ncbi:MAG: IgGFc-binding protein, partial [Deltaproteobacteria bacterium]|nr:IgGFc-binding protein [Deltaproteobacteria bacterium]
MTRVFSTIPALLVLLASCGSPEGGAPGDLGPTDGAAADLGAPDAGPADAAPELPPPCTPGARRCLDAETVQECQGGVWKTVDVCADTHFCAMGTCVLLEDCTPGTVSDCFSYFQQTICNPEGTGYVPMDCPEGQLCVEGLCAETDCLPGQARCADAESKQVCSDAGSWQEPEPCGDGMTCVGGKCLSACMSDPKWNNSSIGCEYWTVDLDQSDKATLFTDHTPPAESPHSVVLSNPGTASAVVNFSTLAQGIELPWTEEVIQPGETRLFTMPRMDLEGAGIFDRSVRIVSNRPLVATQFNPQDAAETYSNDSSLLLPAEMLGNEYVILGWPSQMEIAFSPYPALLGYFTVVAVEEGETEVEVSLSSPSFGIVPNAPDLPAGQTHTFTLSQYEVLQLEGVSKTMALENDMSGSRVLASKKVAVFVGHEGPLICPDEAIHLCTEVNPDGSDPGCCCLEHLEEQLWPVSAWASEYVMAKIRPRGSEDWDTYRVQ